MFYEGDLQSGIALAIQEAKFVACFVRDDGDESFLWERSYFQDNEIAPLLQSRTVLLRLDAGSQEAGYLSVFCPISKAPTLVIIHHGQHRETLAAGTAPDELKRCLKAVLADEASITPSQPLGAPFDSSPQQHASTSTQDTPNTQGPIQTSAPIDPTPSNTTVQNLLNDRRDRLQDEIKRKRELLEKARQARALRDKTDAEVAAAAASPGSSKSPELTYAQQQRKRQQDARQERDRIMQQIEASRADRREREERRQALARAEVDSFVDSLDGASGLVDQQIATENFVRSTHPRLTKDCAIQVRLLDGSTIRSRFHPDQTLRLHVRPWVDEQRPDGDAPYTFKQILAPKPARAITISEEEESLQSLGLTPSATLVMVPVQGSIAAYGIGGPGLLSRGLSAGYGLVTGGVEMVTGALGTFLGVGQTTAASASADGGHSQQVPPSTTAGRAAGAGLNVRTLRDQRAARDDHQLYNGNQLNFEPRKDQDGKKD